MTCWSFYSSEKGWNIFRSYENFDKCFQDIFDPAIFVFQINAHKNRNERCF